MELVKVLSFLLDRCIAINLLMSVPFLMCINIFSFSSVFNRHLCKLVSANLHEVNYSAEVTFSLSGRNKAEIASVLIFMGKDFWKTSQGQHWHFFVIAKLFVLFPQTVQMCQQIKSHFLVRFVRQRVDI